MESKPPPPNQWMALLNLGWLIVVNLVVFLLGGLFLDKHFGTAPVFLVAGVLLAFLGCGYTVYRTVEKLSTQEKRKPQV